MLDYIEVNELEKRWANYKKNSTRSQISFFGKKFDLKKMEFDTSYLVLLLIIVIGLGAITWLLKDTKTPQTTQISRDITVESNATILANNDKTSENQTGDIRSLSINDIGVRKSEDAGGFEVNSPQNTQASQPNFIYQPQPNLQPQDPNGYRPLPQDEVIDFGKSPNPPKSFVENKNNFISPTQPNVMQPKPYNPNAITIQTSTINTSIESLKSKFNESKSISYALMISEEFYNKGDYKSAEKWAVISNDIDKNSPESWVLFAKSKFKQGDKSSAITALETFGKTHPSSDIDELISKLRDGAL